MRTTRLKTFDWPNVTSDLTSFEIKTFEELEVTYKEYSSVAIIFNNTSERDNITYTLVIPRESFPFGINQTIGNPGMKIITKRNTKNDFCYIQSIVETNPSESLKSSVSHYVLKCYITQKGILWSNRSSIPLLFE